MNSVGETRTRITKRLSHAYNLFIDICNFSINILEPIKKKYAENEVKSKAFEIVTENLLKKAKHFRL